MQRTALFALHYPAFGGPHNRVLRLNGPLAELGWRTVAVLPEEAGNAVGRLRDGGVEVVTTPLRRLRRTRDPRPGLALAWGWRDEVRSLRAIIRERHADVVVPATLPNPQAAFAARGERAAVLWQIVDSATPPPLRAAMMPMVRRLSDAVAFGGQALRPLHLGARPLHRPAFDIPPSVDTDRFSPAPGARAEARRRLGLPGDGPVVGMVANLSPMKGLEDFVRAAEVTSARLDGVHHVVVGHTHPVHAAHVERVRRMAREAGLDVVFAGDMADVERAYAAMDVLAISSLPRSEGTTTTAMEAMACLVPVVATDVGAVGEVVKDCATGFVVRPRSAEALSDRIVQLLRDPGMAADLGRAGRALVVEHFGVRDGARRYTEAFDAAVRHRRARDRD